MFQFAEKSWKNDLDNYHVLVMVKQHSTEDKYRQLDGKEATMEAPMVLVRMEMKTRVKASVPAAKV